ncbi:MAG: pyrroline-5-carboxylate reductase [Desulfovermiculus sp.]
MTRVGMIGIGNMGSALLKGWGQDKSLSLCGYDINVQQLQKISRDSGMEAKESALQVVVESDYVVLGVKPQQMQNLLTSIAPELQKNQCLISIAAGIRRETLAGWSGHTCPVVRVMPNTPAMVGAGVFALCYDDKKLSADQKDFVQSLFWNLGQVHVMAEEYFDAFTALVATGPAYVYYFMDSLIEAGVALGFPRHQSKEMVQALLDGSTKMSRESGLSATELREMVTSPAGTASAGMRALDRQAVRSAVVEAAVAACKRSQELG